MRISTPTSFLFVRGTIIALLVCACSARGQTPASISVDPIIVRQINQPFEAQLAPTLVDLTTKRTTLLKQYRNALTALRSKAHTQPEVEAIDQEIATSGDVDRISGAAPGLPADAVAMRRVRDQSWEKLNFDTGKLIDSIRDAHLKSLTAMEQGARGTGDQQKLNAVLSAQKALAGLLPAWMAANPGAQGGFVIRTGFENMPDAVLIDGAPSIGYSGKWSQDSRRAGPVGSVPPVMEIVTSGGNSFARITAKAFGSSNLVWNLKRVPADVVSTLKQVRWGVDVRVMNFRTGPTRDEALKAASRNPGKTISGWAGAGGLIVRTQRLGPPPARLQPGDGLEIAFDKAKKGEWISHVSGWQDIQAGADIYEFSVGFSGLATVEIDNVFIEFK